MTHHTEARAVAPEEAVQVLATMEKHDFYLYALPDGYWYAGQIMGTDGKSSIPSGGYAAVTPREALAGVIDQDGARPRQG